MKKMHIDVPRPKSSFLLVTCSKCGKETMMYSHTTIDVRCKGCNEIIAEKTGSRARLHSKEFKRLDQA